MKFLFSMMLAMLLVIGMGSMVYAQDEEIKLFGTTLELKGGMVWLPSFDSITPAGEVALVCFYDCVGTAGFAGTKLNGDIENQPDFLGGLSAGVDITKLISLIPKADFALPFGASISATLMTDMANIKHIRGYWGIIGQFTLYTK